MASHFASSAFSPTPNAGTCQLRSPRRSPPPPAVLFVRCYGGSPYNTLVSEAVRLLVPPARFEASKLKVDFTGRESDNYSGIIPRTYILSHCDFTANLTLTVSNVISLDQLRGWYEKDDVVAEWKSVNKEMCLHIHCFVSGPNPLLDLAAEFRYHIFSKEMPLVLKAVLHGDALLFRDHPELMDAPVWVYFHSSSQKYNRIECWGPLKDAARNLYRIKLNVVYFCPSIVENRENKFKDFLLEAMTFPLCLQSGEALNQSSKLSLPSFCKCAGNTVPKAPSKSPTQFSHMEHRMTQLIGNIAEKLHWR